MNHQKCICAECESQRLDADRYRYLRDKAGNEILEALADEFRPAKWDKLVDEDMRSTSAKGAKHD